MTGNPAKPPSDDIDPRGEALRFFRLLAGEGDLDELAMAIWTAPDRQTRRFPTDQLEQSADYAVARAVDADVYFGVCLQPAGLSVPGRGKAGDAAALLGLWADVDVAGPAHKGADLPPTVNDARALLDETGLPPTVTVDSGHGLHEYWLLGRPWVFSDDGDRRRASDLSRAFQQTLGRIAATHGWRIDSTPDLARVLRVPGTVNRKPNLDPAPVRLLDVDEERRYSIDDLAGATQRHTSRRDRAAAPPVVLPGEQAYARATLDNELQRLRTAAEGTRNSTLNRAAFTLATFVAADLLEHADVEPRLQRAAREAGLADDEIARTLASGMTAGLQRPRTLPQLPGAPVTPAVVEGQGQYGDLPPTSDMGNAERLVARHGADLRYVHPWRSWLVWDGGRWQPDRIGEVMRRAKATARAIAEEAEVLADEEAFQRMMRWALVSEQRDRLSAMIGLATSEPGIPVAPADLDGDPWALNVRNGTVDLRTGQLREHRAEDLLTRMAPVDYDPGARLDLWEGFLQTSTGGDAGMAAFLQRAVGYTLTGLTSEEVLLFVHGPAATGKSTFVEALKATLGGHADGYATTTDFEVFLKRPSSGGPRNDVARLAGARMVSSIEVDEGQKLAEGLVKNLTGGDTITARHLYREFFEFVPAFTLWLVANHRPRISHDDEAMWRRIRVVPFDHVIPEGERDPQVKATLRDPDVAGPAILAWAVQGCLAWQQHGLGEAPAVRQATQDYRDDMNTLAGFIQEACVLDRDAWTLSRALRGAYEAWAKDVGVEPLSGNALGKRLRALGCTSKRRNQGHGWMGIRLT